MADSTMELFVEYVVLWSNSCFDIRMSLNRTYIMGLVMFSNHRTTDEGFFKSNVWKKFCIYVYTDRYR